MNAILLSIACSGAHCGECKHVHEYRPRCTLFDAEIHAPPTRAPTEYQRCPACIEAERKAKAMDQQLRDALAMIQAMRNQFRTNAG